MDKKSLIRKKYLNKRKKHYFSINKNFFNPLIKIIKQKFKNKKIDVSIYYPSFFEVNVLKFQDISFFKNLNFSLPIIEKNNSMNFYKWQKNDILTINKFGVPEPIKSKKKIPSIILVPLIAYDKSKNRIGYGKGYYDRYLNKYLRLNKKKILTVGVAFSFQKHHKLPINKKDFKLDYILTEKGMT